MFLDLIGSTALANGLKPAEYAVAMTGFFDRLNARIEPQGGMLVKFRGDGFLAIFTVESAGPDHAAAALRASLDIMEELANAVIGDDKLLRVRIGIDTGSVAVGEIGARDRTSIDVVGDNVNIAARLEEIGKRYDVRAGQVVLVTARTIEAAKWPRDGLIDLGALQIRGHPERPVVFQLVDANSQLSTTG